MTGITVGQKLYTKNGEAVTLCAIKGEKIVVEYKFKEYVRDFSVIGVTLFVTNPIESNKVQKRPLLEEQEQQKINKKREAKRVVQERIELEKIKLQEIELNGGFKKNVTTLYHEVFGEGVFVEFDSTKRYIHIRFYGKEKLYSFEYPQAFGKHLFIQKTNKLLKREESLKNPLYEQEDLEEQLYFRKVCGVVDINLKSAKEEERLIQYAYNDFSDSFDPFVFQKHQSTIETLEYWQRVRNNPYFARVDHGANSKFYIGKTAIDNLVIDWRNTICNLYYQYNIYKGIEEWNLSLVRDFEIVVGIYCGFVDKYSKIVDIEVSDFADKLITDDYLVKVINANRRDKKTHDIIQTIQRNQYEIITNSELKSMLVLGCAGSGKTMIMLHRLSYMVFNNQDLDTKNVYIISPTRLLNFESNELSRTLNIDSANRLSISLFNASLIRQYYKLNNVFTGMNFGKITSNSLIDDDLIKLFYSDRFIKTFSEEVNAIVILNSEKREKFIEIEETRLLEEYRSFCKDDVEVYSISEAFAKNESLNLIYEDVKETIYKVPLENAKNMLKNFNELISLQKGKNKDETLLGKKEVLEHLISNWNLSSNTIYNDDDHIVSVSPAIFSEVFGYFNVLAKSNKRNKVVLKEFPHLKLRYSSTLQLLESYKKVVDKANRFELFVQGSSKDYLSEIIEQLISTIKKDNHINCECTYEFEVFLHLVGCNVVFSSQNRKRSLLFIDEFQDVALTEISLYKQIFPNALFNLFGDIKQSINPKGMNEDQVKQIVDDNWITFGINENYRNAHQITEFINSEFQINMMPIGIDGSVKYYDISELNSRIKLNDTDRIALIVKSIALYGRIESKYHLNAIEKVNVISDDECEVKRGFLNVIPINLAKGLEFETVYALQHQMTQNEKYVAYTRALSELCIISIANV